MSNMKTTESNLWVWLAKARQTYRDRLHMDRIENAIMRGMPDVEGCISGRQFWIELKCSSRPKAPDKNVTVKFQPHQIPWIERRMSVGGRVRVLLQVGSGKHAARYLVDGRYASMLSDGLPEYAIASRSRLCESPDRVIELFL